MGKPLHYSQPGKKTQEGKGKEMGSSMRKEILLPMGRG